jgi:hypothetical protein
MTTRASSRWRLLIGMAFFDSAFRPVASTKIWYRGRDRLRALPRASVWAAEGIRLDLRRCGRD